MYAPASQSHSLWYTSSRAPILGGLPDGPGGPVSHDPLHGSHHGPSQQNQQSARQRGQVLERTALARLAADEAYMHRRRVNVQNYGSTWLRPPGIPKTLHQMREEKREQEEHQEAMRREQLAHELAEAEAEAAGGDDDEEAMDDVQLDGAQDLDDEIPDADDDFALGGSSSQEEEEEDDDDEEEDEEDADNNVVQDRSALEDAMREERRNDLMAARMRMTDDAFREALVRGDPDGDDMYGGGEELDEHGQGHLLDEEDFMPSSMLDGDMDDADLGMDANLDDDIPEAQDHDGGYEHTDSDAALSSDEREGNSSDEDDDDDVDDDIGFAPRTAPLGPPQSPTLRGQQHGHHRRSTGASAGPRSSMDLSAFLSQDESSFMDSSPVQGRRNMRG